MAKKKGQMCESYDVPRIVKFIVTGSGMMVVGTEVRGGGASCLLLETAGPRHSVSRELAAGGRLRLCF